MWEMRLSVTLLTRLHESDRIYLAMIQESGSHDPIRVIGDIYSGSTGLEKGILTFHLMKKWYEISAQSTLRQILLNFLPLGPFKVLKPRYWTLELVKALLRSQQRSFCLTNRPSL